jgi:hypothetical protein
MAFGAWRHYPAVCLEQKHLHNTCPPRTALRTLSTTSTIIFALTYSTKAGFGLQKNIYKLIIPQTGAVAHSQQLENVASYWYVSLHSGAYSTIAYRS